MKRLIPVAVLALALIAGGGWWLSTQSGPGVTELPMGAADAQESTGDVDTSGVIEMAQGAEDAPVTIIEYASFTCPHCATFHQGVYKQLKTDYVDTGKVRFVHREVFFDRYGLWASMVARCGGEERYFGIIDLIYKGQSDWARAGDPSAIADALRKIGRLAGLGEDKLNACLTNGDKAQQLVAWYEANAEADNIRSTPSFIIDGEPYSNMSYAEFKDVIDAKLGE